MAGRGGTKGREHSWRGKGQVVGNYKKKIAEKYLVLVFTDLRTFIAAECSFVVLADIYKSFVS